MSNHLVTRIKAVIQPNNGVYLYDHSVKRHIVMMEFRRKIKAMGM